MERQPSQEPVYHDEAELQEQLAKERDLMVQSAGDILRITEGFQIEQKKSIRVIDRLYDENQMLKQRLHLPLDSPGTWKEKYGVDVPQSMAGYMNNQNAAGAGGPRSNADKMEYFSDRLNADEALDEIERCARTVERELDELMEELGSAERIVSEETAWAQSQEQGQRQTLYSQTQFRGTY